MFINFFLYGDEYSEAPMADIVESYRLYGCNQHDVFYMEITANGHNDECLAWVNGSELRINTAHYENGIYIVKTDNTMLKLVVRH